jgi:regulator of sirC expression with transglutaminase-like and TPR domain
MVTFNINEIFEQMQKQSVMAQYQATADQLINSYDYNDIKTAVKYAKEQVPKEDRQFTMEEAIPLLNQLFNTTIGWLEANGKRV